MSLKDQIQTYIDNSDGYSYRHGLELYEKAGPGPDWAYLKKFKYSSPGAEVIKKLVDGLKDVFKVMDPAVDLKGDPAGTSNKNEIKPVSIEPGSIQRLKQDQKDLLRRRSKVHAELCLIAQQPESPERANELHERAVELMNNIIPRLDRIYETLERYKTSGELPEEEANKGIELYKKLSSFRSSLSRFKRLQRSNKDQIKAQYYEHKILTLQSEIEAIQEDISTI